MVGINHRFLFGITILSLLDNSSNAVYDGLHERNTTRRLPCRIVYIIES